MEGKKMQFKTKEEDVHDVSIESACQSVMVKAEGDDNEECVSNVWELNDIASAEFKKVIEFCDHLCKNEPPNIPQPLTSKKISEHTTAFYASFVDDMAQDLLFQVLLAANFLDIKPLVMLCCAKIGSQIRGTPIPEVRKMFKIENDFTPEEEKKVMEENKWADEDI